MAILYDILLQDEHEKTGIHPLSGILRTWQLLPNVHGSCHGIGEANRTYSDGSSCHESQYPDDPCCPDVGGTCHESLGLFTDRHGTRRMSWG